MIAFFFAFVKQVRPVFNEKRAFLFISTLGRVIFVLSIFQNVEIERKKPR